MVSNESKKRYTFIAINSRATTRSRQEFLASRLCIYKFVLVLFILLGFEQITIAYASAYDIGVYYFPGWRSTSKNWNDLKGLPGSRSPGISWPEREPLLGYYPEEEVWVAEKHIEWGFRYGIDFFAYDWYWDSPQSPYEHALKAYLKARNRDKLKFCLLWANHGSVPRSLAEFDAMVSYWIGKYFNQRTYYMINGKPVIFVFSYTQLNQNAKLFGQMGQLLLGRAQAKAREKGYKGIYFVAVTNAVPSDGLENGLRDYGYSAYSGWNYVVSEDSSKVTDYNSMVDTYLDYYDAASKTAKNLPYIVPASPGWDSRPWYGNSALVRTDPTPEKFERMLFGAKYLMDNTEKIPKILMIEAWNEFGEGSYIEPTKKWGFKYLETIQKIFTSAPSRVKRK